MAFLSKVPRFGRSLGVCVAAAFLLGTGCKTPVGVKETGFEPVYRARRENVLDRGHISKTSRAMLAYFGLEHRHRAEPAKVIAELEELNRRERVRKIQVTLAELNYDLALEKRDRGRFLAAAVHAYLYLFGEGFTGDVNPFASRFRLACDLYNRGLALAMRGTDGAVVLEDCVVETPAGSITIQATRPGFRWSAETFHEFYPTDAFEVQGLRERVRDAGLGVPLVARQSRESEEGLAAERLRRSINLPATAFLRLDGGLDELAAGRMKGTLELYYGAGAPTIEVRGQQVPLEVDLTAALAYTLEDSGIAGFGVKGFRKGSLDAYESGIFMLQPYQPGKIPLVLIHGTASSPATWAQTVNGLIADPRLRGRYQVWLGLYHTGNPVVYSAAVIRDRLLEIQGDLMQEYEDPALEHMVVVGHSQGGLVTRLLISESGDRIWNSVSDVPLHELKVSDENRKLIARSVYFEPVPFLKRAIFISTPHRGSYVAGGWIGNLASRLVKLPGKLTSLATDLLDDDQLPAALRRLPTSVDNMSPDHRFLGTLAQLPFAESADLHSIIAVKPGFKDVKKGNDGVVKYTSAHLDDVVSEFVVRSGHSCHGRPEAISELRRILFEHLKGIEATDAPAAGAIEAPRG